MSKAGDALRMMQDNLKGRLRAQIETLHASIRRLEDDADHCTGSFRSVALIAEAHGDQVMADDARHLAEKHGEPYIRTEPYTAEELGR